MSTFENRSSALTVIPTQSLTAAEADLTANAMTVQQVLGQLALVQQIMGAAMKDGEHYGRIPGCGDKATLLKPGAEKLCTTFRLAPSYDVDEKLLDAGHREYRITCTLTSILTRAFIGQGVGICTTMEGKYRFRQGGAEPTDKPVPRAYWDVRAEDPKKAQELIGGKGFTVKKVDGKGWMIAKGGEKVENDNPADNYNTVLKMAKKRALVDAVLTSTAASDIFTQDLEDINANLAAAGAINVISQDGDAKPTSSPVVSSANAQRGSQQQQAPAAPSNRPAPVRAVEPAPPAATPDSFLELRVHFGKNRGLMLSELTPQQLAWYLNDWMPKKEVNGPTSVEDLALIQALKDYRRYCQTSAGPTLAPKAKAVGVTPTPKPEDESQEIIATDTQLETTASACRVTLDEVERHLVANDGKNGLPKCASGELLWLAENDKVRVMEKLPGFAPKIIAERKAKAAQEAVPAKNA